MVAESFELIGMVDEMEWDTEVLGGAERTQCDPIWRPKMLYVATILME